MLLQPNCEKASGLEQCSSSTCNCRWLAVDVDRDSRRQGALHSAQELCPAPALWLAGKAKQTKGKSWLWLIRRPRSPKRQKPQFLACDICSTPSPHIAPRIDHSCSRCSTIILSSGLRLLSLRGRDGWREADTKSQRVGLASWEESGLGRREAWTKRCASVFAASGKL